jgi:hypothetical protein
MYLCMGMAESLIFIAMSLEVFVGGLSAWSTVDSIDNGLVDLRDVLQWRVIRPRSCNYDFDQKESDSISLLRSD